MGYFLSELAHFTASGSYFSAYHAKYERNSPMETVMKSAPAALCAAALAASPAFAQEERDFDLPDFDRIDVSAGVALVADVGEAQSVTVVSKHGDFSDFEIEVAHRELSVSRRWNRLSWHNKKSDYKVIVTVPTLRSLDASSGAHARVSHINAPRFSLDLSSGAHATLDGVCDNCALEISSGAHLTAKKLECGAARIDVSSGGHGEITASDAVIADASSGGHFSVYGNPERVSIDKSSGGRVKVISAAQANNR